MVLVKDGRKFYWKQGRKRNYHIHMVEQAVHMEEKISFQSNVFECYLSDTRLTRSRILFGHQYESESSKAVGRRICNRNAPSVQQNWENLICLPWSKTFPVMACLISNFFRQERAVYVYCMGTVWTDNAEFLALELSRYYGYNANDPCFSEPMRSILKFFRTRLSTMVQKLLKARTSGMEQRGTCIESTLA